MTCRSRWLRVVLGGSLLLAACGGWRPTAGASAPRGSVLKVAIGVDPDTLDPKAQTTTAVETIVHMAVESLTTVSTEGQLEPGLASDWQEAPDAMSWVFTLRSGVRFSDGAPLDAAAVKASIDRALDPSSSCPLCGVLLGAIGSVDVEDRGHVRLRMTVPLAADALLGALSRAAFGILSPRTIQMGMPAYAKDERPVGTGPYVLEERVNGDHLTLVRNHAYWGQAPFYERQVFQIAPDAATRESLVRSGQDQVALLPPITDLPSMRQDSNVRVLLTPGDRSVFVAIDTVDRQQPLLRNPLVRQALNYAINRDAIVKSTLFGAADPATSAMAPSVFGYCAQSNPYTYDPGRARSMLQRANATGLTISLLAPTGRYIQDFQAAENVAGDLRAVGVNVQGPQTMDWPTYVSRITVPPDAASADTHMLGWAPAVLDANDAMMQFDPRQIPPHGLESSYYDNPTVTALIVKAESEPDRDARAREYCEAQKQIWSDAPWIFLWIEKFPIVYSAQVTGVTSIPTETLDTVHAHPV